MIDDLLQKWYATGAVTDGHRYVSALHREGWLAPRSPQWLFDAIAPGGGPGAVVETMPIDDGRFTGVALEALQQLDAEGWPRASLLRAWLDDVAYLVLPQRWARTPVRMLRVRATTCPDAGQIGTEAYALWLSRVRAAYGLASATDAPRSLRPTSTSAVELDLGELMANHWRRTLREQGADPDWLRPLLARLDLVLGFRGEQGDSVDPPMIAFDRSMLSDRVLERVAALEPVTPVQRDGDAWQLSAWSWKHGDTGEQVGRLTLRLETGRWWLERE